MTGPDRGALARAVAEAAAAVPGVSRLVSHGGPVEVATQYRGGTVPGVRLADRVEVHLAVDRLPVPPITADVAAVVRVVLAAAGDRRPVEVVVADIEERAFPAADGPAAAEQAEPSAELVFTTAT